MDSSLPKATQQIIYQDKTGHTESKISLKIRQLMPQKDSGNWETSEILEIGTVTKSHMT